MSHADTHPDHVAVIAMLVGLEPPAVDRCRVLEIGSASGGNLFPMADGLPGSQFVGVDYSAVQVAAAEEAASALGLGNVRFVCGDIREVDLGVDCFDYIIAHGVYSWVPFQVREALLSTCSRLLSPNGVAYISYNTYPGWLPLMAVREMMLQGSKHVAGLRAKVEAGTETLQFIERHAAPESPVANYLDLYSKLGDPREEMEPAQAQALLAHDLLSEHNEPSYYHEFVAHAERHGLVSFADADFPSMFPRGVPDTAMKELTARVDSRTDFEQYADFFGNRSFRKSLLCRDISSLSPTIRPDREIMGRLRAHTLAKMEEPYQILGPTSESLVASSGARVSTNHPLSKAALVELAESAPLSVGFEDLVVRASGRLVSAGGPGEVQEEDVLAVATNLLQGFSYDAQLVDLRTLDPTLVGRPTTRPRVSPVTRHVAATGALTIANAYHQRVQVDPIHAAIISLLDGERDRARLRVDLDELVEVRKDSSKVQPDLNDLIDEALSFFAAAALLTA